MSCLVHGGDWAGFQAEYGTLPLDFSANISPLGLPSGVKQAIVEALPAQERYPDPLCRALRVALGESLNCPPDWILCGNGAADLIWRLALTCKPRKALVLAPTFAEYGAALQSVGCRVELHLLKEEEGFRLGRDILPKIGPDTDLVLLCEPNNPTGRTTDHALLVEILRRCEAMGIWLVVDECFNAFLQIPEAHTLRNFLAESRHLLLLSAFTKWYAMAGIRLGYALSSNRKLLWQMQQNGQPWSVSGLAQAAGIAALQETAYSAALHALIQQERPRLAAGLVDLGCRVIPGEANYLLFFCEKPDFVSLLREKGVLVRDCSNYVGLCSGWYRAAVRGRQENDAFLQVMKEVL